MGDHLGEFEQLILFALVRIGEGAYGVSIRQEIEGRVDRTVSAGAVYTALERLERRGYVSSWVGDPTPRRGGRRKRFYGITGAGAQSLSRSHQTLKRMADGLAPKLADLVTSAESGGER